MLFSELRPVSVLSAAGCRFTVGCQLMPKCNVGFEISTHYVLFHHKFIEISKCCFISPQQWILTKLEEAREPSPSL